MEDDGAARAWRAPVPDVALPLTDGGTASPARAAQEPDRQAEVVARLGLPYPLLSDADGALARAMGLPTFEAGDRTLLGRLTMLLRDGRVERVWYPVFPPDGHASRVLADLGG